VGTFLRHSVIQHQTQWLLDSTERVVHIILWYRNHY